MDQITNEIISFLIPRNDMVIYAFLFTSAVVENLFPPVPGDTITLFGAFLVGTGRLSYPIVYTCTTLGSTVGFMLLVLVGRLFRRDYFIKKNFRFFPAERIEAAERWFNRWGYAVVLANRFMPGVRSVISLVTGMMRLRPAIVFLLSLASAAVWNLIWIHVGYVVGNNWDTVRERASEILRRYHIAVGIALGVSAVIYVAYRLISKRRSKKNLPLERHDT